MRDPSPWLSIAIDLSTLAATAAIALIAHRFSKQQLALQMIGTFMDCARAFETAAPFPIRGGQPLTQQEFAEIDSNVELRRHCNALLNQCEVLCSCVEEATIDVKLTRRIAGPALTATYQVLAPYIGHLRVKHNIDGAWEHFGRTATAWGKP